MKHTIKLLTLAFTLVTILTLTGCPGPVTPDKPCTHEHTKTEVVEEATCTEDGLGKIVCVDCEEVIEEQKLPIDPENHDWVLESDTATCTEDGVKTHKCSHCNKTRTEDSTAHHTFIAGGCDKQNCPLRYQYADEDDYQIMVYVYSSVEDVKSDNKEVLYFSFPNDTTGIPQIVSINGYLRINLNDLIQMKNEYIGKTVKYAQLQSREYLLEWINNKWEYDGDPTLLTDLENRMNTVNILMPIYIVLE